MQMNIHTYRYIYTCICKCIHITSAQRHSPGCTRPKDFVKRRANQHSHTRAHVENNATMDTDDIVTTTCCDVLL